MNKLEIVQNKAKKLKLLGEIKESTNPKKKYDYIKVDGTKVSFGNKGSEDYLDHKSYKKRDAYRARHSKIKLKSGERAIDVYESPAFLSYYLLW